MGLYNCNELKGCIEYLKGKGFHNVLQIKELRSRFVEFLEITDLKESHFNSELEAIEVAPIDNDIKDILKYSFINKLSVDEIENLLNKVIFYSSAYDSLSRTYNQLCRVAL